jgi:tetratricopeptide (TPR) repeat protein
MGNVIYCETKEANTPYIFFNTRVQVYSYEEVCYYIINNPSLISADDFSMEFVDWVRDKLNMPELADKLTKELEIEINGFERFLDTFLTAYNYLTKEDVRLFFVRYKDVSSLSEPLRLKKQADGYLNFGKYVRAIRIYETITALDYVDDELMANVYHNMGVALSKNLDFAKALVAFEEAYNINKSEITLNCYLTIFFMLGQEDEAKKEAERLGADIKAFNKLLAEYLEHENDYQTSEEGRLLIASRADDKYGKEKEARVKEFKLIEQWKEDYRRQTT